MAPPKAPAKPKTVAEYLAAAPKDARARLREIRTIVRAAAPGAVESLKWSMPAHSYKRILVMYAAFKNHVGFYPTPSAIAAFEAELAPYQRAKGSVQFPLHEPMPLDLIARIVEFRVKEARGKPAPGKRKRSATEPG